jgi:hypothetical protein
MFDYYKRPDYSTDNKTLESIKLDDFVNKMVIFGMTPDEKSIRDVVKICQTYSKFS